MWTPRGRFERLAGHPGWNRSNIERSCATTDWSRACQCDNAASPFAGGRGRRYQVEMRSTLARVGDWTATGPLVTAPEFSGEAEAVLSATGAEGCYRVRLME